MSSKRQVHGNLSLPSAAGLFLTVRCLQSDLIKTERQKMIYCLQGHPDLDVKF